MRKSPAMRERGRIGGNRGKRGKRRMKMGMKRGRMSRFLTHGIIVEACRNRAALRVWRLLATSSPPVLIVISSIVSCPTT